MSQSWGKAQPLPGGNGRFLPTRSASSGSWPRASTQPRPELWEKPVATHRHTQAPGPRPEESGTHGQLLWQPRGSFHSPPRRSPRLLPEWQPTGLCAPQERAIKPALWRWPGRARAGAGRAEPISDLEEARESDPGKPEHAGCAEPESRSAQAVPLPGFPAPPSPGTGEWRTRQVPLVTV